MACIKKGSIQFTGSIGDLTAYTMRGTDKIIIRAKGGPDKKKIKTAPTFQRTREINAEFASCGVMTGCIRSAIIYVNHMADYNYVPTLNALMKHIQKQDTVNPHGRRHVELEKHAYLLDGFQLNRQNTFDSVVRHPVQYAMDRNEMNAIVKLPNLVPGLNIRLPWQNPLFRIVVSLGPVIGKQEGAARAVYYETAWNPAGQVMPSQEVVLQMNKERGALKEDVVMILSIGIETGMPVSDNLIRPVKYAACAKILATA